MKNISILNLELNPKYKNKHSKIAVYLQTINYNTYDYSLMK